MLSRVAAHTQQTELHGQFAQFGVFLWPSTGPMVEADTQPPNDNINFHNQYWCCIKVIFCVNIIVLYKMSIKPQFHEPSPQICRNYHHNPQSPWACLPQSKLEHRPMVVGGSQEESSLLHQGEESAQKVSSVVYILRQQEIPAGLKGGLGWSHPSGRKSSADMGVSILRQLGELLDKPVDVIPVKYVYWRHFGNPISWLQVCAPWTVS